MSNLEQIKNEHQQKDEEYQRQIKETIEFKKRQWVIGNLRQIIADMGATIITDEEFQQIVENLLKFMDEQQSQGTIVVNEITLGGAINAQQ